MLEKLLLNKFLDHIENGAITVQYWDGERKTFGKAALPVTLVIKNPKIVRKLISSPSLGFGEAYMNNEVEVSNLTKLVKLVTQNNYLLEKLPYSNFSPKFQENTKKQQSKQIQHHYDLGNEFFKLWLDKSMTYSCAYFKNSQDTLEQAQEQKREHILKKLHLQKNMTLLDIGCGWGQLLIHAAKKYHINGFGITLSNEQYKHAKELAKKEKVENFVTFKLVNYQDLPSQSVQFDRIVSVGMFEHVGENNHTQYFNLINKLLKEGGISLLHTISTQTEKKPDPWIDKYIFPGGYIPSVREILHHFPGFNFRLLDYENLRIHYAMTLDEWLRRFTAHKQDVIAMYNEKFYRMWFLWLTSSAQGFRYGDLDLSQFVFSKGINNTLPLTRKFLYT